MTGFDTTHLLLWLLLGTAGMLLGGWHFASLRWISQRLLSPGAGVPWLGLVLLHLLRLGVLVGTFWFAARQGAGALLALALGVLVARAVLLARTRRVVQEDSSSGKRASNP